MLSCPLPISIYPPNPHFLTLLSLRAARHSHGQGLLRALQQELED